MQSKFAALAKQRVTKLSTADPALQGGFRWSRVTSPSLGWALAQMPSTAWYLAAVYDLAVAREGWQSGSTSMAHATSWMVVSLRRCKRVRT